MPYAEAMAYENAPINLCPPGGVKILKKLGELLQQDPTPFIAEMEQKARPNMLAVVREAECIGCTKCIQACPVDAILGSAKQMHAVITAECTGCELCVPACPVDCIDMMTLILSEPADDKKTKTNQYRKRFYARQHRLAQEKAAKKTSLQHGSLLKKKSYIQDAIARAKAKNT